jgi:uncharacterized damage-inducible protein DinB
MVSLQFFRQLFDYDHWANRAALESVKAADAAGERAHEYLRHVIGAERIWLARFSDPAASNLTPWPTLTLEECAAEVENLHTEWLALLDNMKPEGLAGSLTYRNTKGVEFTTPIADVLTHLVMHSAYHRGQVAKAVREAGGKPAATDYVAYVRLLEADGRKR